MALSKVPYVEKETIIHADNLNAIQDEIIANGENIGELQSSFVELKNEVESAIESLVTDPTLSQYGKAADAGTVGYILDVNSGPQTIPDSGWIRYGIQYTDGSRGTASTTRISSVAVSGNDGPYDASSGVKRETSHVEVAKDTDPESPTFGEYLDYQFFAYGYDDSKTGNAKYLGGWQESRFRKTSMTGHAVRSLDLDKLFDAGATHIVFTLFHFNDDSETIDTVDGKNLVITTSTNSVSELRTSVNELQSDFSITTAENNQLLSLAESISIPFEIIGKGAVNSTTGSYSDSSTIGLRRTDFVDVSKFAILNYKRTTATTSSTDTGMAFYDAGKTYISGRPRLAGQSSVTYVDDTINVPDNAAFAMFTLATDSAGDFAVSGKSKLLNKLELENTNIENQIEAVQNGLEENLTNKIINHVSKNLCNPDDVVLGRLESDGTIDDDVTSIRTSGYIPVSTGDSLQIYRDNDGIASKIYRTRRANYDANKTLIDYSTTVANSDYTVPEGVAYIRLSFDATYSRPMIAVNYTNGDPYIGYYVPYAEYTEDFITSVLQDLVYAKSLSGKKVINFGDSIFGNFTSTESGSSQESISNMIAKMTGAICYNCAFGGTHAKTMGGTSRAPLDFQSLVTAIISGVWTDQEAYATEHSEKTLAKVRLLESIDFSTVDIVTVSYGTNDWTSQVTPEQYSAALTDGITRLGTAFPNLLFAICTPIIRFKHADDPDSDPEDNNGVSEGTDTVISSDDPTWQSVTAHATLPEFAEAAEEVGHDLHCTVSENYWSLGINLLNYETFMNGMAEGDLVHPNAKGRNLIARHLADVLLKM